MSEKTKGAMMGVAGSVAAGIILYVLTGFLDPRPHIRWGTYGDYRLQQGIEASDGFNIAIENTGGATARNLELLIQAEPNYVIVTPNLPFTSEFGAAGYVLQIDALGPSERLDIEIAGARSHSLEIVRVDGEAIDEGFIPQGEFRRRYGVDVPLLAILIPAAILIAMLVEALRAYTDFRFAQRRERRAAEEKPQQALSAPSKEPRVNLKETQD